MTKASGLWILGLYYQAAEDSVHVQMQGMEREVQKPNNLELFKICSWKQLRKPLIIPQVTEHFAA